jgi:tetratricopeptide (TPR) repeat protein
MAREGLTPLLFCAGLLFGVVPAVPAAPPEGADAKFQTLLVVQRALEQGRACLQRGDYQAAVYVLESQVAYIDGSRDYLAVLREAYRGYVRELQQNNRLQEVPLYQGRLQILDPGTRLDPSLPRPAAPAPVPTGGSPGAVGASSPPTPPPQGEKAGGGPPVATATGAAPSLAALAATTMPPGGNPHGPPAAPPTAPVARGVPPEGPDQLPRSAPGDPFADSNSRPKESPRALVARAGHEFLQKHYETASRLYEQAHQADANATAGSRDQWAYCKLHAVVEALGRQATPTSELEAEVRRALAMTSAPELEKFGQDLLRRIQEGRPGAAPAPADNTTVEVRHTPAQGQGWAIAETTNFRVHHRQSPELAEKVAHIAEATRVAMSRKWFGDVPPAWTPRCEIWLHPTAQDYTKATPAPAWSPGHSTMHAEGERVLERRMDLRCDAPHLLEGVVPHETTHIVLCGRFGRFTVPRWVDEGVAVLTEPRELIEMHLRNLPRHRQEQTLFPLVQLTKFYTNYPDGRSIGPFYAQSVSLVEFLSSQPGGPREFIQFVRDGLAGGYEAALRKHYGIQGFEDLEKRWQQHAFTATTTAARISNRHMR